MEIDFENAAFTVFIVLITRVILPFDLSLHIPISHVDLNMQRADSRGAATNGKFFFRRHMSQNEYKMKSFLVCFVDIQLEKRFHLRLTRRES